MGTDDTNNMETRVIEAAKVVFVRKGYVATTMKDIADEVGISRTSLHYYFRTKETLFEAIFEQLMKHLLPNIETIINEKSSVLEKAPAIVTQYLQAIRQNMLFPIFVVSEINRDPEHLFHAILKNPSKIEPLLRLREQIYEEMEQGLIQKRPLVDIASTLLSLVLFPFLLKTPLTKVFMDNNEAAFKDFLLNREKLITEIMLYLLTPNNSSPIKPI
ncbi:TetR/AcrR family transcriptional regulator [Parabacteroides sp. PF5-5]|uniref:TetR/AcrR family transcriptional regulator n=2 Tax=unclassified Parabacteroides TaxID=2649774 RepID=UPI002476CE07|nr:MULTISPECIES: TetR/AcrR family transcriptional regulator [unclassified Parabacteroides]MDH6305850.1 TetR/AcrR family transcriptional regulator [Parabacteroides sp. PH5-39]MDH6324293.1 TetR/AcrR family transcriptional regulator [Parabacteroides sp. PH5-8]MDH6328490.1 TetR/AcrR family transcriptional regulator [Parabacteroides sp. PH5-41]MDH6362318.1 TetR/AcrR family transcriptional regulator [Parabacteroides sp. PH5-16]MDH6385387.1 TetR/AcrR family transcriptional regulator [Parabacteroides 